MVVGILASTESVSVYDLSITTIVFITPYTLALVSGVYNSLKDKEWLNSLYCIIQLALSILIIVNCIEIIQGAPITTLSPYGTLIIGMAGLKNYIPLYAKLFWQQSMDPAQRIRSQLPYSVRVETFTCTSSAAPAA